MSATLSAAILASVSLNCTITVVQLANTLWEKFMRYLYDSQHSYFIISRTNCTDIFIALTAYISQFSQSIVHKTLISIEPNNNMNWDWLDKMRGQNNDAEEKKDCMNATKQKSNKRIFAVPKPNTFLNFTIKNITFEVLPISTDGITISAYQIGTLNTNVAALHTLLAPIVLGMGINSDSIKDVFPQAEMFMLE